MVANKIVDLESYRNKKEIWNLEKLINQSDDEEVKLQLTDFMNKKIEEAVLKVHKHKITHLQGKDTRFCTYIPADNKRGRKEVKKNTYNEMIAYLAEVYEIKAENPTFKEWFYTWLDYKETITTSSKTIRRHEQHFNRYFLSPQSKLLNIKLMDIDKFILEAECNKIVKNFNITKNEWGNLKTVLNGMFQPAFEKGIIKENTLKLITIGIRFRQINKQPSEKMVLQTGEYEALLEYLDEEFKEKQSIKYIAVKFGLFTVLRIGEIIALKWEDLDLENRIMHVQREEVGDDYRDENRKWHGARKIVDHTKGYKDRYLDILSQAIEVLNLASFFTNEGFVFRDGSGKITTNKYNHVLEDFAEYYASKYVKRSHALRRTYASRQQTVIPISQIQADLGHSDLRTTQEYLYTCLLRQEIYDKKAACF